MIIQKKSIDLFGSGNGSVYLATSQTNGSKRKKEFAQSIKEEESKINSFRPKINKRSVSIDRGM